jgi:FkbM family methyltransferase
MTKLNIKQNTTQNNSFFINLEKKIRSIPHIYIIFRSLVRFTNYFENDFFYLRIIFKNKKINVIDVGASDGISALFFMRNLNANKIYCYEPQKVFFKKLKKLKKKYKNLILFNYGLAEKNFMMDIFYPYIKFLGIKFFLLTYSFPVRKELEDQINLDFLLKPKIQKSNILVKKYKMDKDKIDLIKIDTNGSEVEIVKTLKPLIKRDKPVLIIENNNIDKIFKILKVFKYKKYCIVNKKFAIHKNQNNANIIFK